ncbi:acyl carrier protein [Actinophytocola sediminis]
MSPFTVAELGDTIATCLGTDSGTAITESTVDVSFAELGYDSLAVYELMTRLQDDVGIEVSDDDIDTLTTPRLVIEFVNSRTEGR